MVHQQRLGSSPRLMTRLQYDIPEKPLPQSDKKCLGKRLCKRQ